MTKSPSRFSAFFLVEWLTRHSKGNALRAHRASESRPCSFILITRVHEATDEAEGGDLCAAQRSERPSETSRRTYKKEMYTMQVNRISLFLFLARFKSAGIKEDEYIRTCCDPG